MTDSSRPRFTLYFTTGSYYSHKVLIALYEKGELFTEKRVNTGAGENIEKWYMEMNPAGQVPVLSDRGKIVTESERIIDYIDREIPDEPRLVPPPDTELGREVARFRALLEVPIPLLTYGIWYNPELAPGDITPPKDKQAWDEQFSQQEANFRRLADEHPDLRDAFLKKAEALKVKADGARDKSRVKAAIDELQTVLDQLDQQIVKAHKDASGETWLLGPGYTAADISLAVMLNRLTSLGLDGFYTSKTRPALYDYWDRVQKRLPFIKIKELQSGTK